MSCIKNDFNFFEIIYYGLQVSKDTYFTKILATCDYLSWPKYAFNISTQINQILKLHEKHATWIHKLIFACARFFSTLRLFERPSFELPKKTRSTWEIAKVR